MPLPGGGKLLVAHGVFTKPRQIGWVLTHHNEPPLGFKVGQAPPYRCTNIHKYACSIAKYPIYIHLSAQVYVNVGWVLTHHNEPPPGFNGGASPTLPQLPCM